VAHRFQRRVYFIISHHIEIAKLLDFCVDYKLFMTVFSALMRLKSLGKDGNFNPFFRRGSLFNLAERNSSLSKQDFVCIDDLF